MIHPQTIQAIVDNAKNINQAMLLIEKFEASGGKISELAIPALKNKIDTLRGQKIDNERKVKKMGFKVY